MAPLTDSLIASVVSSLMQPVLSSLINSMSGKGQIGGFLQLLDLPLMIKAMSRKGVTRQDKDIMI